MNPEFGCCSLFPSWSGQGLISTPRIVRTKEWVDDIDFLTLSLKMAAEIACQPPCLNESKRAL